MRVFLSGRPRTGKTTFCLRSYEILKRNGIKVGGVITREIVRNRRREGFEILNLKSGERIPLAHIRGSGPRVGKYRVFVENIDRMISWMKDALREDDFLIIDEIGPMELLSKDFLKAVDEVINSGKDFIITVHLKKIKIVERYKPYTLFVLTFENRNEIWENLKSMLFRYIKRKI